MPFMMQPPDIGELLDEGIQIHDAPVLRDLSVVHAHRVEILEVVDEKVEKRNELACQIVQHARRSKCRLEGRLRECHGVFLRFTNAVIPAPPKARLVLAQVVGVEIHVQSSDAVVAKLEDVAETSARSLTALPPSGGHRSLRHAFDNHAVAARHEHELFDVVLNPLEDAGEALDHLEDRRPPLPNPELRKIEGGVFVEELQELRISTIHQLEVLTCDRDSPFVGERHGRIVRSRVAYRHGRSGESATNERQTAVKAVCDESKRRR
jgi:hypothetical protein